MRNLNSFPWASIFVLALAGGAVAAVTTTAFAEARGKQVLETYVPVPMPPGVQVVATDLEGPVFADARGRTLYTWPLSAMRAGFAGDSRNATTCTAEVKTKTAGQAPPYPAGLDVPDADQRRSCVQDWPPLLAANDAKPIGGWSLITRPDGTKQWAFNGQAVYTSHLDREPGDVNGASRTNLPGRDKPAYREVISPPPAVPPGFKVTTFRTGRLVTTAQNLSLYVSDKDRPGKSSCHEGCEDTWAPALAPAAVKPQGEWTLIERSPGVKQWAFRGKPVYTYTPDSYARREFSFRGGDVPGWHNVYTQTAPQPAEFTQQDSDVGTVLADATGRTIYIYNCGDDTLDQLACDHPEGPQQYRLAICGGGDAARCLKTFPYVTASPDAKALGRLWTVASINPKTGHFAQAGDADALRVWAYRGRPVYTFSGDHEPGDINGYNRGENAGKRNGFKVFWIRNEFFAGPSND